MRIKILVLNFILLSILSCESLSESDQTNLIFWNDDVDSVEIYVEGGMPELALLKNKSSEAYCINGANYSYIKSDKYICKDSSRFFLSESENKAILELLNNITILSQEESSCYEDISTIKVKIFTAGNCKEYLSSNNYCNGVNSENLLDYQKVYDLINFINGVQYNYQR